MTRVTTFGQSPDTILPAELNNIQDDYEELLQEYIVVHSVAMGEVQSISNSAYYWLSSFEQLAVTVPVAQQNTQGVALPGVSLFYWDAGDYAEFAAGAGGQRAIKLRLRSTVICNGATAPAANFTFGLRAIQALNGGTLGNRLSITFPTSNVAAPVTTHTTPAANTTTVQTAELADATTLAPNFYGLFLSSNNIPNGSSDVYVYADLAVSIQ